MVDGTTVTYVDPPATFDAQLASNAELAAFNLPSRPSQAEQVPLWLAVIKAHRQRPSFCESSVLVGAKQPVISGVGNLTNPSQNWSGSELTPPSGAYDYVVGTFDQSGYLENCPGQAYSSSWVGLGGDNVVNGYQRLTQAGTTTNGGDQNYFFYEYLVEQNGVVVQGAPTAIIDTSQTPNPGDTIIASVSAQGGSGYFTFGVTDTTKNVSFDPQEMYLGTQFFDGGTADFINERPTVSTGYANLRHWYTGNILWPSGGNTNFADYTTEGGAPGIGISQSPYDHFIAMNGTTGDKMARATTSGSNGMIGYWYACS